MTEPTAPAAPSEKKGSLWGRIGNIFHGIYDIVVGGVKAAAALTYPLLYATAYFLKAGYDGLYKDRGRQGAYDAFKGLFLTGIPSAIIDTANGFRRAYKRVKVYPEEAELDFYGLYP